MVSQQSSRDRGSSPTNRVTEHFREGYDSATHCVAEYPGTAMLVTFATGLGVGLLIGYALAEPPEERNRLAGLGRQMLDTMSRYMPDALAKRVGA